MEREEIRSERRERERCVGRCQFPYLVLKSMPMILIRR